MYGSIWDRVTGAAKNPISRIDGGRERKISRRRERAAVWQGDNNFVILTLRWNCQPEVIDTIGLARNAHDVCKELKAKCEGKTNLRAVLANIVHFIFDNRTEEHVNKFMRG